MEFLFNFSALIQLVAAINFAYILCQFNKRFDNVISNAGDYIQRSFDKISDKINLDMMSLKSKLALSQAGGLNCAAFIDKLTNSLSEIKHYKEQKNVQIKNVISLFVNKEGYGCLFFFLSLYSVLDLAIIAWISVSDNWNISLFLYLVNLFSLIYSLFLFCRSTFSNVKHTNKGSLIAFVSIVIVSVLLVWGNSNVTDPTPMSDKGEFLLSLISIGLPFFAIGFVSVLLTVINFWAFVSSIVIMCRTKCQRNKIKKELKKVDTALEVVNPDGVSFQ